MTPQQAEPPVDDGAASHLAGMPVPEIALPSTRGTLVRLDRVPDGFQRMIVYAYPMTAQPDVALPEDWDTIPGARGCTPESCGFRDHAGELASAGAAVAGLSTQSTPYQQEAAARLHLPFPLLSDAELAATRALRLPTFTAALRPAHDGGNRPLLKRLTVVVRDGVIEKVFYPVHPPGSHAEEVLAWARSHASHT